jgi:hypothetical protein
VFDKSLTDSQIYPEKSEKIMDKTNLVDFTKESDSSNPEAENFVTGEEHFYIRLPFLN